MAVQHPTTGGLSGADPVPERAGRAVQLGLLLFNLLILLVCAGLLWSSRAMEIRDAEVETLSAARLTEQIASGTLDKAAMALTAAGLQVERQLSTTGFDASSLWAIVDAQVAQVPELLRIGVFDAQGTQFCGMPAERCQHLSIADRAYFQRLRERPDEPIALHGPYDSRGDGQRVLILARALRVQEGRFAGVAIAVLPLERLRSLVTAPHVGSGGLVSLRTSSFELLLRQPELAKADAQASGVGVPAALRSAIETNPTEGVLRAIGIADGIERVTAYRRLAKHPLYVFVGQSTDNFLAGWRRQVTWTAAILLLLALASWQLVRTTATSLRRQAQAQRLYDEAPCGYHTLDASGTYLSVNATELAWLGCTREEVVGRLKPSDFTTDEGRAAFAIHFPELRLTGRLDGLDFDLVARDGKTRRVLVSAKAVLDAEGQFLLSNSVMHDITALHEARTQLRALAQQQGLMLDNDLIGIVKLRDRRVVWKNQAMDRIFGYSGEEWCDMPARTLYPDEQTYLSIGAESLAAMQQGQTYRRQLEMRRRDGSKVWIDASGAMLSEGSGETMMMLADISALKEAEEARIRTASLEAQNFQLRETSRLKNEFLANMSHELRTPLNAILGFGQLLASGAVPADSPKFRSFLGQMVSSGQHLQGLIEQMLDYARVEAGRLAFRPETIDVLKALREVAASLEAERAAKDITLQVVADDNIASAVTDPLRLRQMLQALLGNALKFSTHGGSVEVHASLLDEVTWQITVIDHGIGIAEADMHRLFSPFVQLSTGSTKAYGGIGIGLALVRLIAEAMGGRIDVRSHPGLGSVFTLTLPRDLGTSAAMA